MKVLFVKDSQNYPRSSGHDVHGFYMMRGLSQRGHAISLLTERVPSREAIDGLDLSDYCTFDDVETGCGITALSRLQSRFVSYWGIDPATVSKIAYFSEQNRFDAVVAVGLRVLPYLAGVGSATRIWYAADEWCLHHLSLIHMVSPKSWAQLKPAIVKGLYERAFNRITDRVWAVSSKDRSAFQWVMGAKRVDLIPNGVDCDYFQPQSLEKMPQSVVFWGRLDFEPNIDAIRWFGRNVWVSLKRKYPNATWNVFGFGAGTEIAHLQSAYGFNLVEGLPDLRTEVSRNEVVVLPFVSGAGIKNKLLEGAALGLPVVASAMALNGFPKNSVPMIVANKPLEWINQIERLWGARQLQHAIGEESRNWVRREYSWETAAKIAEEGMIASLE
jgi:glycosyltransferase involved in cell wall biosynthesis